MDMQNTYEMSLLARASYITIGMGQDDYIVDKFLTDARYATSNTEFTFSEEQIARWLFNSPTSPYPKPDNTYKVISQTRSEAAI